MLRDVASSHGLLFKMSNSGAVIAKTKRRAIQNSLSAEFLDCLASASNEVHRDMTPRSRDVIAPESCNYHVPRRVRGRREHRVFCAPAASRAKVRKHTS